MSQTYDPLKPISGTTTLGGLYQIIRDHIASVVSSFSGTAFPSAATAGQKCWRTDRKQMYVYTNDLTLGESGWVECAILSAGLGAEIVNARGTKPTLDQRLDVALNEDGTLKAATTLNPSQWYKPSLTFMYISTSSFKVNGDQTDIYKATRRLKINLGASVVYSEVLSASYAANETTITTKDAVVDSTLVDVEHSLFLPRKDNGAMSKEMLLLDVKGAAVASASSCNIWLSDGNTRHITGVITINDFATAPQEGAWMRCIVDAAFILVHSATIDLPGSANITCAAGDTFEVFAETTTTFKLRNFTRQNGTPIDLSSASVTNAKIAPTAVTSDKISNDAIIATKIANSAVIGGKISTVITSSGNVIIAAAATWTPAAGVYQVASDQTDIIFQISVADVWYGAANSGKGEGIHYCDGSLMRFNNFNAAARIIAWQQFN